MINEKYLNETLNLYKSTFGIESEIRMCIEEMSELTKELCKFIRYFVAPDLEENEREEKLKKVKKNIIEEAGDVSICVTQMRKIFGEKEVEEIMKYKLARGRAQTEEYLEKKKLGESNGKSSN